MKRIIALTLTLGLLLLVANGQAAITSTGSIVTDPITTWGASTNAWIAPFGDGTVTVNGGSTLGVNQVIIGADITNGPNTGTLTVDGSGSAFTTTNFMRAGSSSTVDGPVGNVNITNGAYVSTPIFEIGNSGGTGYTATGNVTASGGSTLNVSNALRMGWFAKSTGNLTITGSGTAFTGIASGSYVGNLGDGHLTVSGGASMTAGSTLTAGNVWNDTASSIQITGSGTTYTGTAMNVAYAGNATAEVSSGANMTLSSTLSVGGVAGGNGSLTIDNATVTCAGLGGYAGNQGTGSVTLRNNGVWNVNGDRFISATGATGNGSLTIESGGTLNINSTLGSICGNTEGSTSTVSLDGANSSIDFNGLDGGFYFGHIGSCTLTMSNGSSADMTGGTPAEPADVTIGSWGGSDNTATLSSGSQLIVGDRLTVANGNKATTMTIQSGADVTVGGEVSIGDGTRNINSGDRGVGSYAPADQLHGTVTVTGSGSTMNVGDDLLLGAHLDTHSFPHSIETVVMNIDNSAVVTAGGSTLVGQGTASVDATLDFDGGTLNTASLGADMANITGTGTINTKGLVGNTALSIASTGDLNQTLSNGGSVTINLDIDGTGIMGAGYDGTGSLTVSGGVNLTSTGGMLGYCWGSDGTATIAGSGTVWEATVGLSVGGMGAGTLTIKDGAMVKTGALVIDGDVAKDAAGDLDSYYYYVNYSSSYAGDPSEQFDIATDSVVRISNGGMLALPGNLTIGMGMMDVLGAILGSDELEIMDVSGAWVDGASAVRNTDYTLTYDSGMGYTILTAVAQNWTPGDANKNGKVDSSDLGLLANNWQAGTPNGDPANVTWNMGDFNFDYKVDSSDLGLLANNWQFGVDMGAPNVVPEPSMLILLLGTMLIGWALRKK